MIITCPECATRYTVSPERFGSGAKMVRCSGCGHSWLASASEEHDEDAAPGSDPIDAEAQSLAEASRRAAAAFAARRRESARVLRGWAMLVAVVSAVGLTGYLLREDVVRLVPAAAHAYALAGLQVNVRGIEFRNIVHERDYENGLPVLEVSGELVNVTDSERPLAPLRFALFAENDRELYRWTTPALAASLGPGQTLPFQTRLASPPDGARRLQVRFAGLRHDGDLAR